MSGNNYANEKLFAGDSLIVVSLISITCLNRQETVDDGNIVSNTGFLAINSMALVN